MRIWVLLVGLLCTSVWAQLAELDWLELMPESDRIALENMPEIEHQGAEQAGDFGATGGLKQAQGLPPVMYSAKTVAALDGREVRLGGYPVPLQSNAKGDFTEFFLVPYPGACIHVPPPPPNQIVLIRYPKGMPLADIYAPLWVQGQLLVESVDNELAEAAYALEAAQVTLVDEQDW